MGNYILTATQGELFVREQKFVQGKDHITFSPITSCIGVVGVDEQGKMAGVHLVIVGTTDDAGTMYVYQDSTVVKRIKSILGTAKQVAIVGSTQVWKNESNGKALAEFYEHLKSELGVDREVSLEGTVQASVYEGNIVFSNE